MAVADRIEPVADRAVLIARCASDGFVVQPVDAVEVPGYRSAVELARGLAVANGVEGIQIAGLRCGQLLDPIQLIVGEQ